MRLQARPCLSFPHPTPAMLCPTLTWPASTMYTWIAPSLAFEILHGHFRKKILMLAAARKRPKKTYNTKCIQTSDSIYVYEMPMVLMAAEQSSRNCIVQLICCAWFCFWKFPLFMILDKRTGVIKRADLAEAVELDSIILKHAESLLLCPKLDRWVELN